MASRPRPEHPARAGSGGDHSADDSVELLEENCVQLPFPAYPLGDEDHAIRWFVGQDALLRDDGMAVLARGRTAADLDRVRDLIPGDWLNDYR